MKEVLKNIELIELYFEGKLPPEESLLFEAKLKNDTELANEYKLYVQIRESIHEHGEENLKNKLRNADTELDAIILKNEKTHSFFLKYALAACIAGIVVFIGYFIYSNANIDTSAIADKFYEKEIGLPVHMSITSSELDNIMTLYKLTKYTEAKIEIDKLLSKNPENDTLIYFSGIIHFELKEYTKANTLFLNIDSKSKYYDKAEYYTVLSLLHLNKKEEALGKIKDATSKKDSNYFERLIAIEKQLQ